MAVVNHDAKAVSNELDCREHDYVLDGLLGALRVVPPKHMSQVIHGHALHTTPDQLLRERSSCPNQAGHT